MHSQSQKLFDTDARRDDDVSPVKPREFSFVSSLTEVKREIQLININLLTRGIVNWVESEMSIFGR